MVNEILKTDIPDDWDIKKLEPNVGFVRSGKRLPKGYYVTLYLHNIHILELQI